MAFTEIRLVGDDRVDAEHGLVEQSLVACSTRTGSTWRPHVTNFRSNNKLVHRSDIHTVGHRVIGSAVSFVPFLTSTGFDLVVDRVEQVVDQTG